MSLEDTLNSTIATLVQESENGTLDWIMSKVDQFPIKISFFFACAMVLGSVVPYVPQYFTIKQTQNTEGFSLYVCLTLLVANILRIMFWFGKHFETALLVQSIVMILAMFILLELCVRVRNSNLIIQQRKRYFAVGIDGLKKDTVGEESKKTSLKRTRSLEDQVKIGASDVRDSGVGGHNVIDINGDACHLSRSASLSSVTKPSPSPSHSSLSSNSQCGIPSNGTNHPTNAQSSLDHCVHSTVPKPMTSLDTHSLNTHTMVDLDGSAHKDVMPVVDSPADDAMPYQPTTTSPQVAFTRRHFVDFELRYFWEWTDFISYLECMGVFAFITGLFLFCFIHVPFIVEGYGFVALVTESLLASPQAWRNFKTKSTDGMSKMMVFTWLIGDLYKTIYFVVRNAPVQFLICGFTQITLDIFIFCQVVYYKRASYRKLSKSKQQQGKASKSATDGTGHEEVRYYDAQHSKTSLRKGKLATKDTDGEHDAIDETVDAIKLHRLRTLRHLESRARKRFKANIRTKKMINLLTTMASTSNCPSLTVASVHHPQPLIVTDSVDSTIVSSVEETEHKLNRTHLNGEGFDSAGPTTADLIELSQGYINQGISLDNIQAEHEMREYRTTDEEDELGEVDRLLDSAETPAHLPQAD